MVREVCVHIRIVAGSGVPIFRQIGDQIARAVANGELAVGDAVPSVRQLARDLVINPNTVAKAYAELVENGTLETQPGRGYFIGKRRQLYTKTERMRRLDDAIEALISQSVALDVSPDEVFERVRELFSRKLKSVVQ
jgi:GntR family transcriptional regulator